MPFAMRGWAQSKATTPYVFLGTDTGQGIYRATWNHQTGELGTPELAAACGHPTFLAKHPKLPVLYACNELAQGVGGVTAFRIASGAKLEQIDQVSSEAAGPCYISVDHTGRSAYVANYAGGTTAGFNLDADGRIEKASANFDCRDNPACGTLGPQKDRQNAAHMHCTTISPDNRFMLACNLAEDAIEVFPIAPGAHDPLGKPSRVDVRPGSGPRHVAFHPNGKWVYCIHELDCTIDLYDWSESTSGAHMKLRQDSVMHTADPKAAVAGVSPTGCEILVSRDGRFAYASTRAVDQLTVYSIDRATGLLHELQRLSCGGKIPRYMAFDPSAAQRWLVSCNQGAPGSVTVFERNAGTGMLSAQPKTFAANTPMFVQWY